MEIEKENPTNTIETYNKKVKLLLEELIEFPS